VKINEAINKLNEIDILRSVTSEEREAIDMAINALRESADLIGEDKK
jgi:hypothetical protein